MSAGTGPETHPSDGYRMKVAGIMTKQRTKLIGLCVAVSLVLLASGVGVAAETAAGKAPAKVAKARLFILSGQSNMVGLKERLSLEPFLKKAFPGEQIVIAKSSQGGQPIRRWYKKWQVPKGAKVAPFTAGDLYGRLMTVVNQRVPDGKFDKFASVTFVWMQGERDAKTGLAAVYAESMAGLIAQLKADINRPDMTTVIGRLSDCLKNHAGWEAVRAAQMKVAKDDPKVACIDTDDLNGPKDGLHYSKAGYQTMGERFGAAAVKLIDGRTIEVAPVAEPGVKTAKSATPLKKGDRIVFLGDSITAAGVRPTGYVTLTSKAITAAYPRLGVQVIGAGISGHKVPDCQKRLERDVLAKKPTIVLIYIGINDVWHSSRGRGTSKKDFEAGLLSMIKRINAVGARVILCTPTVIGEKTDGTNSLDKMLDEYAEISRKVAKTTGSQMLDLRKAFITYLKANNKANSGRGVLTSDAVHLSPKGNGFLAGLVLEALNVPRPRK